MGGIAVNLYGIQRATADMDLVIKMDRENISKFISFSKKAGLKPKNPVKLEDFANEQKRRAWQEDKGMIVFSLYDSRNSYFLIDVFLEEPFDFDKVYKKRKIVKFDKIPVNLVSIDELIKMKEKTKRPQDIADIHYLKKYLGNKDEE